MKLKIKNMKLKTKNTKISSDTTHSDKSFGSSPSSNSKIYFNAIDKAHEILERDRELAKKVPSCVVVGMQSVGKSAILSRISGIRFPQDSEVCTRVAIELRLRRANKDDEDALLKPIVIKAGDLEAKEVDQSDEDGVENALKEAQTSVLNGQEFEDKLSVKVEKEGSDLPEVTLIDLPGVFFAKDNEADCLEAQVKSMIEDRVRNEMALILHVVPLNQDTDTISTWRTVRDADANQERTISVLTKADLAVKDKKGRDELKKRIHKILEDSNTSECFVVHGAATSKEHEESQLSEVSNYIEELDLGVQIKVGLKELNDFIEERMLKHIKDKIPEMRQLLETELSRSQEELKILGRQPLDPMLIALRGSQCMNKHLAEAYESFQPEYRRLTEAMSQEIFEIDMKPLGLVETNEAKKILVKNTTKRTFENAGRFLTHLLALEVEEIGEDSRAMINASHVGMRPELLSWLQTFVKPFEMILKKHIDNVFEYFSRDIFQSSIQKGSIDSTKAASKQLELQIKKNLIVKAKSKAIDYANDLVDSVKDNMFTSNEHYLSDTTKKFEDEINAHLSSLKDSYRLDMQRHYKVVCGIRAFFKTRKKMLPDTIQLHITKALKDLFKATEIAIEDQLLSKASVDLIQESARSISRRKFHLEKEKKIRQALDEISPL